MVEREKKNYENVSYIFLAVKIQKISVSVSVIKMENYD